MAENQRSISKVDPCCHFRIRLLSKTSIVAFLILSIIFIFIAAFSSLYSTTTPAITRSLSVDLHSCNLKLNDISPTRPQHILFGLSGSAKTWTTRRHYSQLWWTPNTTRGFVWLDETIDDDNNHNITYPPYRVSAEVSWARRASDRIARILKESYELGLPNVRWFVMGDDDTLFFVENLVSVLSRYDHRQMYYIGSMSESVEQDVMHGYEVAFGGGGFAVSYSLACELVGMLDGCIERYHWFYGSDEKISACVAELGVPLTKEAGFHQLDIRGDASGLLAAHPVAPLVSLHHLDSIEPLFPGQNRMESLRRLMQAYHINPYLTVQQSYCYDNSRQWSLSISWGYTVQLYPFLLSSTELRLPLKTFRTWRSSSDGPFVFKTRPVKSHPCERPIIYFLDQVQDAGNNTTITSYKRAATPEGGKICIQSAYQDAMSIERITVTAPKTSSENWVKAPRRQCCEIASSLVKNETRMKIRSCRPGEAITI